MPLTTSAPTGAATWVRRETNPDWHEWAIECPLHGSVFDVHTGEVLNPPASQPVRTYPVEIEAGFVKVCVG